MNFDRHTLTMTGMLPSSRVSLLTGPPLTDQDSFAVIFDEYDVRRSRAYVERTRVSERTETA